jgi:hypothetical protein
LVLGKMQIKRVTVLMKNIKAALKSCKLSIVKCFTNVLFFKQTFHKTSINLL